MELKDVCRQPQATPGAWTATWPGMGCGGLPAPGSLPCPIRNLAVDRHGSGYCREGRNPGHMLGGTLEAREWHQQGLRSWNMLKHLGPW